MRGWKKTLLGLLAAFGAIPAMEIWLRVRASIPVEPPVPRSPRAIPPDDKEVLAKECWVALGDSVVYGSGEPEDAAWPAVLQSHLRSRWPEPQRTVVNSGTPGETSLGGINRLARDVVSYHPRVAFIAYGLNDAMMTRSQTDSWMERRFWLLYGSFPRSWHLFWALKDRLSPEASPWQGEVSFPRVSPEAFRTALTYMVQRLQLEQTKVHLLTTTPTDERFRNAWPEEKRSYQEAMFRAYNDIIRKVAEDTGAGLIDVYNNVPRSGLSSFLTADGVHPSAAGYSLISEIVADALVKEGVLPEPPGLVPPRG